MAAIAVWAALTAVASHSFASSKAIWAAILAFVAFLENLLAATHAVWAALAFLAACSVAVNMV